MRYTIDKTKFLKPSESILLSSIKDKVHQYFITNTDWEFLKLPCFYSKNMFLDFADKIYKDASVYVCPSGKRNIRYYLNSQFFIGSFIESQEERVFSYKELPKKFVVDTILTTYNRKTCSFYSDYNNFSFAVIINNKDTTLIEKELYNGLSNCINKDVLNEINKIELSTNILKCRGKDNSIINLRAMFYILPEEQIKPYVKI